MSNSGMFIQMKRQIFSVRGITIFFLMVIWLGSCQKDKPDPNENWVAGMEWIDVRDGDAYATVQIGNQIWMAENFNFKTDSGSWIYDNQVENASVYGRLYDWETALRICPKGWHVPLEEEWQELIDYLGGD